MESAKPIEAGCLALHFGLDEITQVVCVELVDEYSIGGEVLISHTPLDPLWVIDKSVRVGFRGGDPFEVPLSAESNLLRIDDPDLQKQIESEKELENV